MISSEITIEGNGATIERSSTGGTPDFRIVEVNSSGDLTLNQTTISGGYIDGDGGGICNISGTLTVTNSTISGNSASSSGGIDNRGDTTLIRSLISGSMADIADEVIIYTGTITANANNLFGDNSKSSADAFAGFVPGASDLTATSDGTDPTALGSILDTTLSNNGGDTDTHALVAGSPAIDAAGAGCPPPRLPTNAALAVPKGALVILAPLRLTPPPPRPVAMASPPP